MSTGRSSTLPPGMEMGDPMSLNSHQLFASGLNSENDRLAWIRMVAENPEWIIKEYHTSIRAEGRACEGQAFNPTLYGDKVLAQEWKAHSTFHRFWIMMTDI